MYAAKTQSFQGRRIVLVGKAKNAYSSFSMTLKSIGRVVVVASGHLHIGTIATFHNMVLMILLVIWYYWPNSVGTTVASE